MAWSITAIPPPDIQVGNFNQDGYPDVARFSGNKLEIFLFMGHGYMSQSQQSRSFTQGIESLRLDDNIWDGMDNLIITLADNSESVFYPGRCFPDINHQSGMTPDYEPPRRVNEADFEIVWESEPRPWGMDRCAVGDLDSDGVNELVTWYKESGTSYPAYILIYKSVGNNEFELFMEESVYTEEVTAAYVTSMLITDLDQNGQKELIYTYNKVYVWEFSTPGEYTIWSSNVNFGRVVTDVKTCDLDQDSITELAFVTSTYGQQPPCEYLVMEFNNKSTWMGYKYIFTSVTVFWQDWIDYRLAVGDFDNDGVTDIVSGNFASVINYQPVDIQYFRYDTTQTYNVSQEWLHTGIPLSCSTPVIADLDNDGENELFAGGLHPNGGSAYVWEGTEPGSGYVAWLDTVNSPKGPTESSYGIIDYNPSVISTYIIPGPPNDSQLLLWVYSEGVYHNAWQSDIIDSATYRNPLIFDIDSDNKKNILIAGGTDRSVTDWEQTAAGVIPKTDLTIPCSFELLENYPNPFNSMTTFNFALPEVTDVRLSVYDIGGRLVSALIDRHYSGGYYEADFDGSGLASGVYLYHFDAGDHQIIGKMVMVK
jgi:hypothetical protein